VSLALDVGKVAGDGLTTALKGAEVDRKVPAVEVAPSHNANHAEVSNFVGDLDISVFADLGSKRGVGKHSIDDGFTLGAPSG
jgi:hypothetical protein